MVHQKCTSDLSKPVAHAKGRRAVFAREYLVDLNATKAAIRAGYSAKTAGSQGHRLLKNVEIQALIQAGREAAAARTEITVDRILSEFARIAFFGLSRFVRIDADGIPRIDLKGCTAEDLDLLAALQIGASRSKAPVLKIRIKALDKLNALEKLARHLGLFDVRCKKAGGDPLSAMIMAAQGTTLQVASRRGIEPLSRRKMGSSTASK